jgi:hypothetical protein
MSYPDPLSSGITRLSRLESLSGELAAGIRNLVTYCRNHNYSDLGRDFTQASHNSTLSIFSQNAIDTNMLQPSVLPDDDTEVDRIRRSIFSHLMEIQNLLQQPTDFLQQLSKQVYIIAVLIDSMPVPAVLLLPYFDVTPLLDYIITLSHLDVTCFAVSLPIKFHLLI